MGSAATTRNWLVPVAALFVAAFAICTAELIVAGILPAIAGDLGVDIPTAGLLITGYALGVAIASPVIALVTGSMPRRALLLGAMAVFVLSNILCALAAGYWMLLGARLLVAVCHGVFFGVAMVIATRVAPEGRQTTAVSLVVAGVTLANVLGVPVGTAIGNAWGWRATFWCIAGAGVLAVLTVALLMPSDAGGRAGGSNLKAEIRATMRPVVLLCYLAIALFMIGIISVFSYIVPLLTTVSGVPLWFIPWVLFGMGFGGVFGNIVGGRLGDWNPNATMIGILLVLIGLYFAMLQVASNPWSTVALFVAAWSVGFGFVSPAQGRILKTAADAPNFASTLISTAFNIGIAAGAAIGAAAISAGWSYGQLPWILIVALGLALLVCITLAGWDRRSAAVANPV